MINLIPTGDDYHYQDDGKGDPLSSFLTSGSGNNSNNDSPIKSDSKEKSEKSCK